MKIEPLPFSFNNDEAKELMLRLDEEIKKAFMLPEPRIDYTPEWLANYQRRAYAATEPQRRMQASLCKNFAMPAAFIITSP
jgi:hypothetical protein